MSETQTQYGSFRSIMDRLQIHVIDESVQDEQGVLTPPKYRQHSQVGIIITAGLGVQVGGRFFTMEELGLTPGTKVMFGEYNAEKFDQDGTEYVLVRAGDVRGLWPRLRTPEAEMEEKAFRTLYPREGGTCDPTTPVVASLEPTGIDEAKMAKLTKAWEALRKQDSGDSDASNS